MQERSMSSLIVGLLLAVYSCAHECTHVVQVQCNSLWLECHAQVGDEQQWTECALSMHGSGHCKRNSTS